MVNIPFGCGLKIVLMGVPVTLSQMTINASAPASAVAIHRLSSDTQQHVIGLQWPCNSCCRRLT